MSVQIGMPQLQLDAPSIARIADSALVDQERLRSADAEVDLGVTRVVPVGLTEGDDLVGRLQAEGLEHQASPVSIRRSG